MFIPFPKSLVLTAVFMLHHCKWERKRQESIRQDPRSITTQRKCVAYISTNTNERATPICRLIDQVNIYYTCGQWRHGIGDDTDRKAWVVSNPAQRCKERLPCRINSSRSLSTFILMLGRCCIAETVKAHCSQGLIAKSPSIRTSWAHNANYWIMIVVRLRYQSAKRKSSLFVIKLPRPRYH